MSIEQLYDKDITRRINPAVVVSEMEEYYIDQEINEYEFTPVITKNVFKFLNAVATKKEGKTGAWISGYYGSGKSHFIKYLFYCLNDKFKDQAIQRFEDSIKLLDSLDEPNPAQIESLKKSLKKLQIDEIMFNIDAVADNKDEKERITRVLFKKLNEFRGYNNTNIALALYLEKPLDENGNFQAFKDKIKSSFNENWDGNQIRFIRRYLDKVIEIAKEFDADIDKESIKASILDRNQDYTIEAFIKEIKEYLSTKDENYRLLFLLDEVSQYIGSNTSLLLNLQTIVEEIGVQVGTQVWIVCTAQQDLSNLINNTDNKGEDFGKILGRFETMISLESQDAAYITKRRILSKKSEGIGHLNDYYKDYKGAIENQFVFDHDLYENYSDKEDFTLTYPFVPYQFRLVSDVFESFSNVGYVGEGVKNTERAILGITHFTANLCKDEDIGYFVPFDLFFNEQFTKNLTHHARGILDKAYNIDDVKNNPFARRVVNVLFMVSNLGDIQSVNFPATIENIALLIMDAVDTPKLEMQKKVETVLNVLVSKNIIQISEGKYRFLKEDEIEVAQLIKNSPITNEDRLTYLYDDVIQKVVKPNPNVPLGNKNFKIAINIDDKEIGSRGDFNLRFSIYDGTDLDQLAHATASQDMIIGIHDWFKHDKDLAAKVSDYVRTQKYISRNFSAATGSRAETLVNFRETNKLLLNEIKLRFEKKFMETAFISSNQVIQSSDITGSTPNARFDEMVKFHMQAVYRKNALANAYASSNIDLLSHAKSKQTTTTNELTPAEEEVNNKLNLSGEGPVVGDIVKQFEKAPYGWKDLSTLDVLLQIARKGHRRFEWRNEEITLELYAEKALNSRERDAVTIHKEKVHSKDEVINFIKTVNDDIFAETIVPSSTTDYKEAVSTFKLKLEPQLKALNRMKEDYDTFPFAIHLKKFHRSLSDLYNERNPEKIVEQVIAQKEQLKASRDTFKYVEEFIEYNFKAYEKLVDFIADNKNNLSALDETAQVVADQLMVYVKEDQEPWDKFPQMKKGYKELYDALKKKIAILKTEVIKAYEAIFSEIQLKKSELGISEANLTADADHVLNKIHKEQEISQLEIYQLKASDFRSDNFKVLIDFKAKEEAKKSGKAYTTSIDVSLVAEMPPTTIENAEQLEAYITKLRERLMVKLAKNKKIYLS
ncbi:BREX system P-loop protein BrxC [Winogradskyella sp. UBA3174]|uniref:BREX system P-loop protein BrxC n=1 Tax=Winogradskyella sp. UBA3174 TaxID=1947785 RepID=UPI0025D21462|nr:BREX system P-loop protein BrxC [Winogradskyella sp. UBA3174]|tara:strand:- start:124949 stop:128458 length:3510 start_codon:yes stop_codon:yes gene_type:complete